MGKRSLKLFVLIDALGWQLLREHRFLPDLLPYRKPLRTVLGFSSGAIPTILTGLPPQENGHWNLFYYDPGHSPFQWLRALRFLPKATFDNRIGRKLMKELGRRWLGLGPLFECCVSPALLPFFDWVEKRNIYSPGGISGAPSIFDHLASAGIPYRAYTYHQGTDTELLGRIRADLHGGQARFFFLYLCELDMFLHLYRNNAARCTQELVKYERQLQHLFACAKSVDSDCGITVFSDHGMAPVRKYVNVVREIEALGLRMPMDYLTVYDSTMARFWFFTEAARYQISERLSQFSCGHILDESELKDLGVLFPDRRYGELIFLLDPGCMLTGSDFSGNGWKPAGMHGYHPDDADSDAVFLSNRPPTRDPHCIADVYGCMRDAIA